MASADGGLCEVVRCIPGDLSNSPAVRAAFSYVQEAVSDQPTLYVALAICSLFLLAYSFVRP